MEGVPAFLDRERISASGSERGACQALHSLIAQCDSAQLFTVGVNRNETFFIHELLSLQCIRTRQIYAKTHFGAPTNSKEKG